MKKLFASFMAITMMLSLTTFNVSAADKTYEL